MFNNKINFILLIIMTVFVLTGCKLNINSNTISNPAIEKLNLKAKTLLDNGDVDGAISRLESINDLNPDYYQTHYNLAIAYYQKQVFDKAIKELNTAITLNKNFPDAYYTLAIVYEDSALSLEQKGKLSKTEKQSVLELYKNSVYNYDIYANSSNSSPDKQTAIQKANELNQKINELLQSQNGG